MVFVKLAVDVKNLVKVYKGGVRALDGVNLEVAAGKVFALLGPNGAGKTTLMRILTTQIDPVSGKAYIFGLEINQKSSEIRKLIGYVPQEMSVWTDISGYENLLIYSKIYGIPSHEREKIIKGVLEVMNLDKVANNLVNTYSGGMMRRLEIACTMLIKPKLLFLDEPTIGLDPSARRIVWEKLISFKKEYGSTIFFNTHYMDEANQYSDQIAIINNGKIVKSGTANELKQSIGGEIILFKLDKNVDKNFLGKFKKSGLINNVSMNNSEMRVAARDAEIVLPKIIETLRKKGIAINRVSITKPTLDDVFLKYAGTRSESSGRVAEVRQMRGMIKRG